MHERTERVKIRMNLQFHKLPHRQQRRKPDIKATLDVSSELSSQRDPHGREISFLVAVVGTLTHFVRSTLTATLLET